MASPQHSSQVSCRGFQEKAPMDASFLRCTEPNTPVDTALLLAQALSDVASFGTGSDSGSARGSQLSSDEGSRKTKDSTGESTNAPAQGGNDGVTKRDSASEEGARIAYTVVSESTAAAASEWNLADGFPFPCPVVRDPSSRSGVYIPGEILRLRFGHPPDGAAPKLTKEPQPSRPVFKDAEMDVYVSQQHNSKEKTISLREALRQTPLRLSHYRDGEDDGNLYDAWLYGDPRESLRERYARMDRGLRSKFIGLKNSSARVRDKVRQKKMTTYKEVAEELVDEIGLTNARDKRSALEAENLKRRVYDVLNVFEAVGLIEKDQKNVNWKGSNATRDQEIQSLEEEAANLEAELENRQRYLQQIKGCYNSLAALAERNKALPDDPEDPKIPLPFVLLHAPESVPVDIKISSGSKHVQFDFHGGDFQMHGDMWALRQLGLDSEEPPAPPPMTFFKKVFAEGISSEAGSDMQLSKWDDPPCWKESPSDPDDVMGSPFQRFFPLSVENEMQEDETSETPGRHPESLARRPEIGHCRKRSRTSSMGECEDERKGSAHL